MTVSVYGAAAEVPEQEWNALEDRATTYSAFGWLRVRQEEAPEDARTRYLIARNAAGDAVAGMEAYFFTRPPHRLYAPSALLGRLVSADQVARFERAPYVIAAGWSEFRGQVPLRAKLLEADRDAAVAEMAAEALAWSRERDAALLCYTYLPLEDALDVARAHAHDEPLLVLQDVESVLSTRWDSFQDYLAWLPRNRRTRARHEMKEFQDSGRKVREYALDEVVNVIAPLNNALMQKYGHDWFSLEKALAIYGRQARYLSPSSSVLLIEEAEDSTPAAFALRYRRGSSAYSRVVGFDYSLPNHCDYFYLLMYEPIHTGRESHLSEINLGLGTYEAKIGRGAMPVPLYSVFVGVRAAMSVAPDAARRYNESKITEFSERFGRFVIGGLDTGSWVSVPHA